MAWAPDYATVGELRSFVDVSSSAHDDYLALAITAASRAIDARAGRQFGSVTTVVPRVYPVEYDRHAVTWLSSIDDVYTTSGLVVTVDGATCTGYTLGPRNASARGVPYTAIMFGSAATVQPSTTSEIGVTGSFGWQSVPTPVKHACLLQAARFAARRNSPYGVASSPTSEGADMRLTAALDVDVAVMLNPYARRVWAA